MTMLANSLSHTILLGIILAYIFFQSGEHTINLPALLIAAFGTGLATTFLTEFLTKTVRLQEDASIGIVFTSLFSLGIVLATILTRNAHIGVEAVMGNVDALQLEDLKLVYIILGMNIILITLFFKEYKITTFDPALSKALGISTVFFNYLLMTQTSATAVAGFRAVGVLMILSFITGPALTARLITHDLKKMIYCAIGFGALASLIGVALSRHILSAYGVALTTGGLVVCVIAVLFLVTLGLKKLGKINAENSSRVYN
jgi:manganese/zinc/iron transport system permease protein